MLLAGHCLSPKARRSIVCPSVFGGCHRCLLPVKLNLESEQEEDENVNGDESGPKDYISEVRESSLWASIRDYLTPLDVLATHVAGRCVGILSSVTKDGSEEGAQPEWHGLCLDHRQNFGFNHGMFDPSWMLDVPEALRDARDDAGDWRKQFKGHLLHELVCASGTKWLEP